MIRSTKFLLRSCPKCGGDLYVDAMERESEWEYSCIQCSFSIDYNSPLARKLKEEELEPCR